jgi:hypothetical protein
MSARLRDLPGLPPRTVGAGGRALFAPPRAQMQTPSESRTDPSRGRLNRLWWFRGSSQIDLESE